MDQIKIVNEDGVTFDDMPVNPLKEKWDKLYPPIPKPEFSQVCDGYSCMWCGRCPHGGLWKCPEEDLEVYNEYRKKLDEYLIKHNLDLIGDIRRE